MRQQDQQGFLFKKKILETLLMNRGYNNGWHGQERLTMELDNKDESDR